MKALRALPFVLAFCACFAFGADRMTVQRVEMFGPNGTVHGKLVMLDDRMIFVDDDHPDMSFVLPRNDISRARMESGRLDIEIAHPYTSSFGGNQSNLVLVMPDQNSASEVVTWMGVPVAAMSGEAAREAQDSMPLSTANPNVKEVWFDVKNGDQRGKLIFHADSVSFESLSDAKHSRRWTYGEIKELNRKGNEVRIEPYHGDKYEFQFKDPAMRDTVYNMLSDKIVGAREGHHQ